MKFAIDRNNFLDCTALVHRAVSKKATVPIYSHLLIQALDNRIYLYGTDQGLGIKGEAQAQVLREGNICLSSRMMVDILRELPNSAELHFSLEKNNQAEILCGKTRFRLNCLPAEDFLPFPTCESAELISIPSTDLRDMIAKINITVPPMEQKHLKVLDGALLEIDQENMEMMGADGYRLSYIRKPGVEGLSQKLKVILPKKSMNELKRILDDFPDIDNVSAGFLKNQVIFKIGQVELFSRLLDSCFPNIRPKIAKVNDKILQINRCDFSQAVKKVSIFTEKKNIKLRLEEGTLYLSSQNLGVGDAEDYIPVDYSGEPMEIEFNSDFILDALNVLDGKYIVMEMSDQRSHGIIRQTDNSDYLYLMMPLFSVS